MGHISQKQVVYHNFTICSIILLHISTPHTNPDKIQKQLLTYVIRHTELWQDVWFFSVNWTRWQPSCQQMISYHPDCITNASVMQHTWNCFMKYTSKSQNVFSIYGEAFIAVHQ